MLSNRDGTFDSVIEIGDPYGGTSNTNYRYLRFLISDFDNNGQMDFSLLQIRTPVTPPMS